MSFVFKIKKNNGLGYADENAFPVGYSDGELFQSSERRSRRKFFNRRNGQSSQSRGRSAPGKDKHNPRRVHV